jgi:hypothetical protein
MDDFSRVANLPRDDGLRMRPVFVSADAGISGAETG